LAHLFDGLVVQKLGDIFSGWIDRIEGSLVVQELVIDVANEISQDSFEVREIKEQAYRIKLFAFNFNTHAIVMTVRILALALVSAQGVSRRKCLFHTDLKHFLAVRPARWEIRLTRRLHEALNFSYVPGEAILRQRLDKNFTILHALNTVIENGQHTPISSGAYQPTEALF
jgi:hypothetical protein